MPRPRWRPSPRGRAGRRLPPQNPGAVSVYLRSDTGMLHILPSLPRVCRAAVAGAGRAAQTRCRPPFRCHPRDRPPRACRARDAPVFVSVWRKWERKMGILLNGAAKLWQNDVDGLRRIVRWVLISTDNLATLERRGVYRLVIFHHTYRHVQSWNLP